MPWNTTGNIKGPKGDKGDPGNAADVAALIHAATSKTPVDADELPLLDSAGSWVLRKFTWASLKSTLQALFFYRGNIVGNVSQSGGVPTGAILQRGSNANGEFLRLADGTLICWKIQTVTTTISNSDGGAIVYSPTVDLGAFPATFLGAPAVALTLAGGGAGAVMVSGLVPQTNSIWGQYFLGSGINRASATYYVSCEAKGRWY